jgi:hypothetical protein
MMQVKRKRGTKLVETFECVPSPSLVKQRQQLDWLEVQIDEKSTELAKMELTLRSARYHLQLREFHDGPGSDPAKAARATVHGLVEQRKIMSQELYELNRKVRVTRSEIRREEMADRRRFEIEAIPGAKLFLGELVQLLNDAGQVVEEYKRYRRSVPGGYPARWPHPPNSLAPKALESWIRKTKNFLEE